MGTLTSGGVFTHSQVLALPQMEHDTLEGRAVRAEAAMRAAINRTAQVENELAAVDQALIDEEVPIDRDGHELTRMGRIRLLGDRSRTI